MGPEDEDDDGPEALYWEGDEVVEDEYEDVDDRSDED